MPIDPSRVQAVFLAAVQQTAESRTSLLDRECNGDRELRRRVETLLEAHDEPGSFPYLRPAAFAGTIDMPGEPSIGAQPGTQIGPYKLLQQIGAGGMGIVYMAEQAAPVRRKVALKIIKPGMDTHEVIARFEAERQALALMDHPNIARVFDAGATEAGRPYFVMELVRGVPVTDYCDQNNLSVHERLELFITVCHAVQHAHQKGIIHRDIKPSNVLVTLHDGRPVPKVIDFGVAKAIGQQLTDKTLFTQFAQMVGTPLYMSPEQAELTGLDIDTRGDIYSLGVMLYELLTGTTPFERGRVKQAAIEEIRRMIRDEEPPSPSTRLSSTAGAAQTAVAAHRHIDPKGLSRLVRGDLDWIVMKALEKDRSRRYETANGFARDVERYLDDEPVQACPPSAAYRFHKFARRNRTAIATATVLAAALVLGTAISTWQAIRATRAEQLAQDRLGEETKARNAAEAARRDEAEQRALAERLEGQATHQLYDARLAQARAGSLSRRVGQRLDSLDALAEAGRIAPDLNLPAEERTLERRNAAIACLALSDLRLARQWPGWPTGSCYVDFDGRLEHYARADKNGAVSIRRVADDKEIVHLPETGSDTGLLLSRDGKFLAVWSGHGFLSLNLWQLGGDEPVRVVQLDDAYGIDFSPDSRQCAIGRVDGPIRLYDLASGQAPRELPQGRRGAHLAFHPGGRQLAVSCDNSVEIRDLDTEKVVPLQLRVSAGCLAWSPDRNTLAVVGSDSRVYLWDVAAGKQTLVLDGVRNGGINIAFNHSGDLLASGGWEGVLRLWDPRTGKQLFSTPSLPGVPRFSLDDRLLATDVRDGKLGLWEVVAGGEYRTLVRASAAGDGSYHLPAMRSDGRLLAVGMHDGVGLWDLTSGKELAFLASPGSYFVLFEPSGALLTNGSAGLLRWPIQADPASPDLLRIGPPHKLSVPGPICHVACSRDGRVIAVSQFQGGRVLHSDRPNEPVRLGPHDDARYVAVSPDGRWVATGSHSRAGVKIWEARSGELATELPGDDSRVGFRPDGKRLATAGRGGLRLWAVGSWQEGPRIDGDGFAFAPDGKLLAVETLYGSVRLVDPDTGREYARLEDPNQDRAVHLSFSPDGTRLAATNNDSQSIHVWDLRMIREQLAKMGLDWDLAPYPPPAADPGMPLRVEVDLGDLAAG